LLPFVKKENDACYCLKSYAKQNFKYTPYKCSTFWYYFYVPNTLPPKRKCKGSVQEIKRKRITTCKRSLVAASPDSTSLPAYNQIQVIIACRPDQQQ
jgi:hypothetical protein